MSEKSMEFTNPSLLRSATGSLVNHTDAISDQSAVLTVPSWLRSPVREHIALIDQTSASDIFFDRIPIKNFSIVDHVKCPLCAVWKKLLLWRRNHVTLYVKQLRQNYQASQNNKTRQNQYPT